MSARASVGSDLSVLSYVRAACDRRERAKLFLQHSEYLSALSRYPRERDWPDVRVLTFRQMIYSEYWYQKRLKSSLYRREASKDKWAVILTGAPHGTVQY